MFLAEANDLNQEAIFHALLRDGYVMAQEYVPAAAEGEGDGVRLAVPLDLAPVLADVAPVGGEEGGGAREGGEEEGTAGPRDGGTAGPHFTRPDAMAL